MNTPSPHGEAAVSVTETIERLRSLQNLDERIRVLTEELDRLPKAVEAAKEDQEAVQRRLEEAEAVVGEIQKRRRELEREIAEAEQHVVTYETQKLKVKTNAEYQALNAQIAHEKARRSGIEDQVLVSFDEEEAAAQTVAKTRDELALVTETVHQKEEQLRVRSAEGKRNLEQLRQERQELAPQIPASLLARYEAIRSHKGGLAVVPIVRGACGGCFTQQPPQKINEVRKQDRLHTCEFCGRFLVWDPTESSLS